MRHTVLFNAAFAQDVHAIPSDEKQIRLADFLRR